AEIARAHVRDTPGDGIRQQVLDAENRRVIDAARTHLQNAVPGAVVSEAQLVEGTCAEVAGDVQRHVLRSHIVGLAVVPDGAAVRGEPIEEVVAERKRSLGAEDLIDPDDELIVVADVPQGAEEVVSSRGGGGGQRIEIEDLFGEGRHAAGRNQVAGERVANRARAGGIRTRGGGIENRLVVPEAQAAEVAAALLRCRNAELAGAAGADSGPFIGYEEECAVAAAVHARDAERSAECAAEEV